MRLSRTCLAAACLLSASAVAFAEVPAREFLQQKHDLAQGRAVYEANCTVCHDNGVMDAPKPGDVDAWRLRLSPGFDVVVHHAIEGFKAMPARGGNQSLTDKDVADATAFMAEQSL